MTTAAKRRAQMMMSVAPVAKLCPLYVNQQEAPTELVDVPVIWVLSWQLEHPLELEQLFSCVFGWSVFLAHISSSFSCKRDCSLMLTMLLDEDKAHNISISITHCHTSSGSSIYTWLHQHGHNYKTQHSLIHHMRRCQLLQAVQATLWHIRHVLSIWCLLTVGLNCLVVKIWDSL